MVSSDLLSSSPDRLWGTASLVVLQPDKSGQSESRFCLAGATAYTTKPTGRGIGLVLSVSSFIITQNHGGSLSADSSPGHRTRFIMVLPKGGAGARATPSTGHQRRNCLLTRI